MEEEQQEKKWGRSFETNLGWSEGCRDTEMGMTRRTPKAEKDAGEEQNSQKEGGTEETSRKSETP